MAGEKTLSIDDDLIEIPGDTIAMGFDDDGLPITVPVTARDKPAPKFEAKSNPREAKKKADEDTLVDQLRKERDARAKEAAEAQNLAAQAQARAQAEATARAAAEADAAKNRGVAVNSHMQRMYAEKASIEQGLASAKASMEQLKDMHERALTDGDNKRIAEITTQQALVAADLREYEKGKSGIEAEIEKHKRAFAEDKPAERKAPERAAETQKQPTPDEWIASCPPETHGWLKSHREYVTDAKLNKKLMLFSEEYALDHDGVHSLNTSEFIAALNAKFFPEKDDDAGSQEKVAMTEEAEEEEKPAPKQKAKVAPAAPVKANSVFSSTNPNARHVKLPPKLAQFVKEAGLNPTKYALQTVEDIKAGKLPKNFLDPDYPHDF